MATKILPIPDAVESAAEKYGLHDAELLAIRLYTSDDYQYINPAVANQKDHPERQQDNVDWMRKYRNADRRVTLMQDPDEREYFQKMREQYQRDKKSLSEEGALHAGIMVQALKKLPPKSGTLYRGDRVSEAEFKKRYGSGALPVEGFMSATVSKDAARVFACRGFKPEQTVSVFCVILVRRAYDINELSVNPTEGELLLQPGEKLVIKKIEDDPEKAEGTPPATAWKKVFMEQPENLLDDWTLLG